MHINFNGRLYIQNESIFSVNNRGFKYGDGLFESIRVFEGEIPFLQLHFDRLAKGMEVLQMNIPEKFSPGFLQNEIRKIIPRKANARIRLSVFRADGGKYLPADNSFNYCIENERLDSSTFKLNEEGLRLNFFEGCTVHYSSVSKFKTCNSLPYIMGALFYKKNNLDDALMLNNHFRIAESTNSNIFLVKNKLIFTPPLSEGCVMGSMRAVIINLCKKLNVPLVEKPVLPDMIWEADEIFLTNAIQGVRWVGNVGDTIYKEQHMAEKLLSLLNKIIIKGKNQAL